MVLDLEVVVVAEVLLVVDIEVVVLVVEMQVLMVVLINGWLRGTDGRTSFFDQQTFPVLRSTCS